MTLLGEKRNTVLDLGRSAVGISDGNLFKEKDATLQFLDLPAYCKDDVQIENFLGDWVLLSPECIQCNQFWISGIDCLFLSA